MATSENPPIGVTRKTEPFRRSRYGSTIKENESFWRSWLASRRISLAIHSLSGAESWRRAET
ncbi:hypothetical protein D3C83_332610 [compost metagenome]